ncbi:MAG TPA: sensor domain-containing diguanylate cyclase, partial [Pseudomonas sp.]|nr:sensor domain-containing diguanylate cyclase [Pseudomonas sp.]
EFVLVLPETDAKAAERVAERCRSLIFKEQIPHANSEAGQILTVSMGIGTIVPGQHDDPRAFLDAVDRSLYQAKQQGRNRIVNGA